MRMHRTNPRYLPCLEPMAQHGLSAYLPEDEPHHPDRHHLGPKTPEQLKRYNETLRAKRMKEIWEASRNW